MTGQEFLIVAAVLLILTVIVGLQFLLVRTLRRSHEALAKETRQAFEAWADAGRRR